MLIQQTEWCQHQWQLEQQQLELEDRRKTEEIENQKKKFAVVKPGGQSSQPPKTKVATKAKKAATK